MTIVYRPIQIGQAHGPSRQRPLRPSEWRRLKARGNSSPYGNAPSPETRVLSPHWITVTRSHQAKFLSNDHHVKRPRPDQANLGEPLRQDPIAPIPLPAMTSAPVPIDLHEIKQLTTATGTGGIRVSRQLHNRVP
jgi:hypothetical protein